MRRRVAKKVLKNAWYRGILSQNRGGVNTLTYIKAMAVYEKLLRASGKAIMLGWLAGRKPSENEKHAIERFEGIR